MYSYPRDDKNELGIVNVNFYTNLLSDNSFRATGKCNNLLKYLKSSIVGISGQEWIINKKKKVVYVCTCV